PQSLTSTVPPLNAFVEAVRWSPTTIPTCVPSDMISPGRGWPLTITYEPIWTILGFPQSPASGYSPFGCIFGSPIPFISRTSPTKILHLLAKGLTSPCRPPNDHDLQ